MTALSLASLKDELSVYYLPCKARKYLNGLTEKTIITLLRQLVKLYGYTLNSCEKYNRGVKHIIYPTTLTSNPYTVPVQDADGIPTQDDLGENLEGTSLTNARWDALNQTALTGDTQFLNVYNWTWEKMAYGQRYGLLPEISQSNGWFTIDEREGKFSFSSNLASKLIILEYVSDGLALDADSRIPKMAEEAIYMHIAYSILAGRSGVQEYIVQRFKKDRRASLRNAKIRLSNIKLGEIAQVMRGKSKRIKH